jgi:Flp pilus assembly protein TadG
MKLFRDENGQTMVFTALAMVLLVGFMALALDVSLLFRARRRMQIAADAAATAASLDYYYTGSVTSAKAMAQAAATKNGVTNGDANGDIVTVNCAPASGPHAAGSCNGYFEALVTQPNPVIFMGFAGLSKMNVGTRAVAGGVTAVSCMWLMNPTGTDLSLQGAATIENPNGGNTCGIYVNSTDPSSVKVTGNGNSIDAAYVATQGGITGSGTLMTSDNTKVPTQTSAPKETIPTPYQNLTAPDPSTMTCKAATGATKNIQGTTYTYLTANDVAGMTSAGLCFTGNVFIDGKGSSLNLPAGMYVFSGPNVEIGDNVIGPSGWDSTNTGGQAGVTFDVYSGALSVNSTSNVKLHAPTQGTYNGVLLLGPDMAQDASCNTSTWNVQWGSANGVFDGMIVAPCVNLSLQDQGGSALVSGLIVGKLSLATGTLEITNYGTTHPTSPLKSIVLVE